MKLAAVVVWYNPKEDFLDNLKSYLDDIDICYIIDNSNNDNSNLIHDIQKVKYIANNKNLGIAAALNIGCKMALESGYEWCLTLDQDSFFENNQLKVYKARIEHYANENNISFSIRLKCPIVSTSLLGDIKRFFIKKQKYEDNKTDVENVKRCITSGNIFSLSAWKNVNGFDESFFIDEVDHDFCFKLFQKNYSIILFNDIYLTHVIGNPGRKLTPHYKTHNGIRIYYIIRNKLYMIKRYPELAREFNFKKEIAYYLFDIIFHLEIKNLIWFIRGVSGYLHNKKGIYK